MRHDATSAATGSTPAARMAETPLRIRDTPSAAGPAAMAAKAAGSGLGSAAGSGSGSAAGSGSTLAAGSGSGSGSGSAAGSATGSGSGSGSATGSGSAADLSSSGLSSSGLSSTGLSSFSSAGWVPLDDLRAVTLAAAFLLVRSRSGARRGLALVPGVLEGTPLCTTSSSTSFPTMETVPPSLRLAR